MTKAEDIMSMESKAGSRLLFGIILMAVVLVGLLAGGSPSQGLTPRHRLWLEEEVFYILLLGAPYDLTERC